MRWKSSFTALAGLVLGAGLVALLPTHALFVPRESPAVNDPAGAATGERWACPMMDFISDKPGDCPVCGMEMTRVTAGALIREQQDRVGLELVRVTEGPAIATVRAYGAVRYDDRTLRVVIPRVGGRVVKRHAAALHPGVQVKAGDPIVDLYSPEAFAAQGELAAAVALRDEHTIVALTQRFERWNLAPLAHAIVEGRAPVDTITITSPFSGLVVLDVESATGTTMEPARLPQVGQEMMADTPILRLVDPNAFMLVIHVPESRAHWLRVGQPVQLASDDRGDLTDVEAGISWIAPELNLEIRAREVHVHLRDPKHRLLAGSLVSARIKVALASDLTAADTQKPDTLGQFTLVPKSAVLSTGVRHVAWRVTGREDDGPIRLELAPLALGPRLEDDYGNDLYIVRAGLKPGDEVAAQGVFLIDAQSQLAGTPSLLFPLGANAADGPSAPPVHQH